MERADPPLAAGPPGAPVPGANPARARLPVALAVGGSDSCGGAGVQADLRTFHQWRVHGAAAITAVTAQNTTGVQRIQPLEPEMVAAQIESVAADLAPAAVKTGMLANAGVAEAVAARLREGGLGPFVLDPVMVATSGDRLLEPGAAQVVREQLLPLAALVTPNWPEAAALAGGALEDGEEGMARAARTLVDAGAGAALVKGGHLPGPRVADMLWDGRTLRVFRRPRIGRGSVHGTGCALAAAATAALARGAPLADAVEAAAAWVHEAISGARALGRGARLLDHFAQAGDDDIRRVRTRGRGGAPGNGRGGPE